MNLHIDFILPSERRNPNPVSWKAIKLIAWIVGLLIVLVLVAYAIVIFFALRREVQVAEAVWSDLQTRHQEIVALRSRVQTSSDILTELEGWKRSALAWHKQLLALQAEVAPSIQLTSLKIEQTTQIGSGTAPTRLFTVTIRGVARGTSPENDVQALQQRLRDASAFASLVRSVEVSHFGVATDVKEHRVFQITCRYQPRDFL
ncbi:MAG: hypothetical protein ACUVWX_14120 [Kiritimatiellia bacterium]